jgi:hypothetical protein
MELNHLRMFVRGACAERMDREPNFCPDPRDFAARTLEVVWAYLEGRKTLDGSCSDFECWLAHEAAKVFGWPEDRAQRSPKVYQLTIDDSPSAPPMWVTARNESAIRSHLRLLAFERVSIDLMADVRPGESGIDYVMPDQAREMVAVLSFLLNA